MDIGETDIAVTLAEKELLPLVEEFAVLYDIPLNIHMGVNLGETPEGRFFEKVRGCVEENFSLDSMKALILNGAYPWKEPEKLRELIYFGADNNCLRNTGKHPGGDLWNSILSLEQNNKPLLELYGALKKGIISLSEAKSFSELGRSLEIFLNSFMDTDNWKEPGLAVFQRCRRSLGELRILEERLSGADLPSPLDFLIKDLGNTVYVTQRKGGGIPVYAYRVSAGIYPKHHFILGLSQSAAQIQLPVFPFLREDQRAGLGLEERDFTAGFIRAYILSGENVSLSFSARTLSGPRLPAGYFVVRELAQKAEKPPETDPFESELRFWKNGDEDFLSCVLPVQGRGAGESENIFIPRKSGFTEEPFAPAGFILKALEPLSDKDGRGLLMSSYRLDSWSSCRFAYYLNYGLGLGEINYQAGWVDHLAMGNLRHDILFHFFKDLGENTWGSIPEDELSELMKESAERVFSIWEKRKPIAKTPFWEIEKDKVLDQVLALLGAENKNFYGYKTAGLESSHEAVIGEVLLSGRIDRVSVKNGREAVIDYKSSIRGSAKSIIDAQGNTSSFQMPIYIILLRREDRNPEAAAYFDLKEGKYKYMFNPVNQDAAELMDMAVGKTMEQIEAYSRECAGGNFQITRDCSPCMFRYVCRTRYAIREASVG